MTTATMPAALRTPDGGDVNLLTRLPNRTAFETRPSDESACAERYGSLLSLLHLEEAALRWAKATPGGSGSVHLFFEDDAPAATTS
jgi:hypothetical protein